MRQGTTLHIGLKRVKDLKQPVCGTYNQPIPAPPTRRIACRFSHPKIDMRRKHPPKKVRQPEIKRERDGHIQETPECVLTPCPLSHSRGLVQMTSSDPNHRLKSLFAQISLRHRQQEWPYRPGPFAARAILTGIRLRSRSETTRPDSRDCSFDWMSRAKASERDAAQGSL